MSTLITIVITYYLLIIILITKHNNYCSVEVMESCLLNLLILIDTFLCNSYLCVLFESLSHVINQKSNVYSWNLGKIYRVDFLKFIPNFPLKHVITSTNLNVIRCASWSHFYNLKNVKNTHSSMSIFQVFHVFKCFLNCKNGNKSCKASQIIDKYSVQHFY